LYQILMENLNNVLYGLLTVVLHSKLQEDLRIVF
jgi:hypothetical protein